MCSPNLSTSFGWFFRLFGLSNDSVHENVGGSSHTRAPSSGSNAHRAYSWLNEDGFKSLKEEVQQQNKYERFNTLLNRFADGQVDHPFMAGAPQICVKFVPLMVEELKRGVLQGDLVQKVIKQFGRFGVFTKIPIAEDVEIQCTDGIVRCNRTLLMLQSAYFNTLFTTRVGPHRTNEYACIDFNKDVSREACEYLKTYYYEQKIPQVSSIEALLDLFHLTEMIGENILVKSCIQQIQQKAATTKCSAPVLIQLLLLARTQRTEKEVLVNVCVQQIKQKLQAMASITEAEEMCHLIVQLAGLADGLQAMYIEVVERYLDMKQIRHEKASDGQNLLIPSYNLSELSQEGIVAEIIRKCVCGCTLADSSHVEEALFLSFSMSEEHRQSITEIVLTGDIAFGKEISQVADLFPNIKRLTIKTDLLIAQRGLGLAAENASTMHTIVLRDLSFLATYNCFQQLLEIHFVDVNKTSDKRNLVLEFSHRLLESLSNSSKQQKVIFDFGPTTLYFSIQNALLSSKFTAVNLFKTAMSQSSYFGGYTLESKGYPYGGSHALWFAKGLHHLFEAEKN